MNQSGCFYWFMSCLGLTLLTCSLGRNFYSLGMMSTTLQLRISASFCKAKCLARAIFEVLFLNIINQVNLCCRESFNLKEPIQFEILINCFSLQDSVKNLRGKRQLQAKPWLFCCMQGIIGSYVPNQCMVCLLLNLFMKLTSHVVHIPVSFIFWDVIQVLNFVYLDLLLLGMLQTGSFFINHSHSPDA